jgi:predicted dienelactone hydrolase
VRTSGTTRNTTIGRPAAAVALALVLTLVGAACSDSDGESDADRSTTTTTTRAPAPDESLAPPDEPGPYAVGRTTLSLDDTSRSRPLVADVWYPADAGVAGDPSVYQFLPGIEYESPTALADVPVSAAGPFPLVVYSHGSGGLRYISAFFTELLASHGFVVASVDHVGNTAVDLIGGAEPPRDQMGLTRVLDVEFLISQMLSLSGSPSGQFAATVDPARVGVTGHSFGGYAALGAVSGVTNSAGSAPADDRIVAAATMAGWTENLSDDELAAVDVPMLLLSGTKDETTPIADNTERPFELITGRPLWRVDLTDAGHQSFSDVCTYQELLPGVGAPQALLDIVDDYALEGCGPGLAPIDDTQDLINRNMVAFLLAYVAGESDYEGFLAQEVPGETVQVEE